MPVSKSSNLQKYLSAVHPVKHQPVRQQNRSAKHERIQAGAKEDKWPLAQVGTQTAKREIFAEMRDQISCNGIRSDHNERERQLPIISDVDDPSERCKKKKAQAAAEQCPTRRPNPLYDGADASEMQQ